MNRIVLSIEQSNRPGGTGQARKTYKDNIPNGDI
jgi:hypothetical protein